jgi:hypothetical protein
MDKKFKTQKVTMTKTSQTSDIGNFKEGDTIPLPPKLASDAIKAGIAEPPRGGKNKKKTEVKTDGKE